jgi:hypothetical protein
MSLIREVIEIKILINSKLKNVMWKIKNEILKILILKQIP